MFNYPSLVSIGLPLVALPLLIHLINMLRHRRVKWAAMDFLLQSQKRHKKWIILKQLLLLLLRMTAIAAVVMMVAQPILRNAWGDLFGAAKTHHIVLLDDSYSMSDHWMDTSAFAEAKNVVQRLAQQIAREGSSQTFSLLRFSDAQRTTPDAQPAMIQKAANADLTIALEKAFARMRPSQTAASPAETLDALSRQPSKSKDETRIIYLVSDFRTPQWHDATPLRASLEKLTDQGARIHLVQCVEAVRDNLTVTKLGPQSGVRAAGVEMLMEVGVHNFRLTTAR
ncbi:MAG: BatA domain-containing protein, partial [Acidimicrobiales bacterium]